MVIFISETHFILTSKNKEKLFLWGVAVVIALFSREIFIVFLPIVLLSMFLLHKRKKLSTKSLLIPGLVFCFFIALNIPSLQENHKLSYDTKNPPSNVEATWVQRQYYAQMLVNNGKLKNYNHPTWAETDAYLTKNGKDALPNNTLSGLTFDIIVTVKEFFRDFLYIGLYSIRQLGLILLVILFFGFREFYKKKKITTQSYIPVIVLIMILIFAIIIISFVELRWLGAVFIMSILYYSLLVLKNKIPALLVSFNYEIIILICFYGMYSLFQKII